MYLFCHSSNLHGLVACGGEDGAVECFDMRMKSSAACIPDSLLSGHLIVDSQICHVERAS